MLFNSPVYIFAFLPIALILYFAFGKTFGRPAAKAWLVVASLFFYGYWNPIYILLLASSILVNFGIGSRLQGSFSSEKNSRGVNRKTLLTTGIIFNVGLLGYFKYADFFLQNLSLISNHTFDVLNIALPLAISFFTFQQIAYLVDAYREETKPYSFLDYSLFVTFFPQLIAGPIVHHKQMMPQFEGASSTRVDWNNIATGIAIFCIGLFKKVIIADTFAIWANAGFDNHETLSWLEAWGASLSYTFQLYYDFSGYTDMAIGAALLFNVRLPINFDSPYKALNIQDFWRRWHITLSNWLRDYVYVPLGGNREGSFNLYRNLILTFLIGGFWHGAGWTFVIWGLLHGIALVMHRVWSKMQIAMPTIAAWLLTFVFINITWVFFRADSVNQAFEMLAIMFSFDEIHFSVEFVALITYFLGVPVELFETTQKEMVVSVRTLLALIVFGTVALTAPNSLQVSRLLNYKGSLRINFGVVTAFVFSILVFASLLTFVGNTEPAEFLYFNF